MNKEVMKQALDAIKRSDSFLHNWHENHSDDEADHYSTVRLLNQNAIKALEEALKQEQDEPVAWMTINEYGEEDDIHYENPEGHLMEGWTYKPLYTTPQVAYMRMPKVGDRVVCIEDEDSGIVQSLTAGGSPEIKFDDGSHGTYLLREFAELFRYADTTPQIKEWISLTEEQVNDIYQKTQEKVNKHWNEGGTTMMFPITLYKEIEAKLKGQE